MIRNRLKRLIRESFREHQDMLNGLDIIVIARHGLARARGPAIFEELATHWTELAQWKNS